MIPAALTALVRDHDVTQDDFSSLRFCRAGADKVSVELEDEFAALVGIPIDEGYGMTEVGLATVNPPSGVIKRGSIGPPVPGFSISIRDDDGAEVGAGTVGRGLDRSRRATRSDTGTTPTRPPRSSATDGSTPATSCTRTMTATSGSSAGRSRSSCTTARTSARSRSKARWPSTRASRSAGVVGIHDAVHGENVRAYVTVNEGADRPTSADLIEFVRARIGYKAPEEVVFLDEMPLNPTGKVDRVGLKRLAEDHLHPHLDS